MSIKAPEINIAGLFIQLVYNVPGKPENYY